MEPDYWPDDETPFVNEECGDTMWNDENLNPPKKQENYASVAFTEEVKALQERFGSRKAYAHLEQKAPGTGLRDSEKDFIKDRDSFYIASIGENGFPYVQHRGGKKGFLHMIDPVTLGFADLRGNKQYITVGNTNTHPKVSIILMDYAHQARLKIYAELETVDINSHPDLAGLVIPEGYQHLAERIILLHVIAFDWNCPKYITPRYSVEEINEMLTPLQEHVKELEAEVLRLKGNQQSADNR
ncbi:pyridoxamine 5'-phosphate oxidase family protein [Dyadobacter sp. CY347]|uniref:pyridoxamine 5'-phosphate oxidase family protein n=1 Tax=Dyadobacter sp. CY347 TaxID=2909336 RepID=UPI001F46B394|nr:pyridoxamine 5'-phosphate oxidase family protein [Dyadobacter sp. CY347]MCF2489191.1 pyridoxamine 5'-phosphate oxidase family protein [Dyadobacter sp. CY347]